MSVVRFPGNQPLDSSGFARFLLQSRASFGNAAKVNRDTGESFASVSQFWVEVREQTGKKGHMGSLVDRTEFRAILKEVVKCLIQNLDAPGVKPLAPDQLMSWFQNITLEDLQAVARELNGEQ